MEMKRAIQKDSQMVSRMEILRRSEMEVLKGF